MLDTREVAALLREYGERTALRGGNPYRARAYRRAAENLVTLTEPLEHIIEKGELRTISRHRRRYRRNNHHACKKRNASLT